MGHLILLALGAPEVRHDGQAVSFPTRKALALLMYLAVEGGQHRREKLAALLWPESDGEHSRMMLRRTLAYLREGLRADQSGDTAHLLVGRDQLGFDAADAESDLRAVELAWARARQAPAAGGEDQRGLVAQLRAAAGRYRGDFLDGFALSDAPEFDTWASVQREVWHRRMSVIFDRLAAALLDGGALVEALEIVARWVAHAPLDEAAHRRRMLAHAAAGERAAALRAYEACRALLEAELSAEPAPETEALAERIRAEKLRIENATLRKEPEPAADQFSTLNAQFSIPMVGRLNEHAQLVAAYTAARRGQPRAVLLEGAPGVGKTRLAREFLRWAAARDAATLRGQALATTSQLPYQPLLDALRGYLAGAPNLRDLVDDVWIAPLGRLLPELRAGPRHAGGESSRQDEFEALAHLFQRLASAAPVVLFVDDLEVADPVTRDCLLYLGRRWAESGTRALLLCALAQPADTHASAAGWLQSLGRALPLSRLQLGALATDDALRLAQALVADDDLAAYLAAETRGNPAALFASLQVLHEHGAMGQDERGRWVASLPAAAPALQALVAERVAALLPAQSPRGRVRRRPTNLPAPPTALVGRALDVAALRRSLLGGSARLLTLIGPPGIGKTRLAIKVAEESLGDFEDGVCFVALSTIQDPRMVAGAVAQALAFKEAGERPLAAQLAEALRDRHLLLVLDNFEQVLPAATLVAELLSAAPGLSVLATSRSALHIYGEHECAVAPLPAPDIARLPAVEELAQVAAVQLFVERAQAVKPDFRLTSANAQAVAEICAQLEGMPLAIELAAAWSRSLSAQALLTRLSSQLALLTGGPRDLPARQQSLRGAIAWSYDLLDAAEQTLLARLGMFVGGWTVAAAAAVVRPELQAASAEPSTLVELESLAAKSLLRRAESPDDQARFTMLEAIREYALERLDERGETGQLRERHTAYMLALAERIEPDLGGPRQGALLEQLECEHDNMRAALSWAIERDEIDLGLRLCVALWWFWFVRGYLSEGRRWLEAAIANCPDADLPPARALLRTKALNAAGVLAHDQADYLRATVLHEQSLALARQLGLSGGIAASLNNLGLVARSQGDYQRAADYYAESLALRRAQGDEWSTAIALSNLGLVARDQGRYDQAAALFEESLALRRKLGDQRGIAMLLNNLGVAAFAQPDYRRSAALHEQSLAIQRELADRAGVADSLYGLGQAARALGDAEGARRYYQESLALRRELGDQAGTAACLEGLAALANLAGRPQRAAWLLGAATALRSATGAARLPLDAAAYDQEIAAVRARLGEAAFAAAWAEGQAISSEQVVRAALDDD